MTDAGRACSGRGPGGRGGLEGEHGGRGAGDGEREGEWALAREAGEE